MACWQPSFRYGAPSWATSTAAPSPETTAPSRANHPNVWTPYYTWDSSLAFLQWHVLQFHLLHPLLQGRSLCGWEALCGIGAIGQSCPPTSPGMGICFPVWWLDRVATVMETSSKRHRAYGELEVNQVILQMSRQVVPSQADSEVLEPVHDFLRCTQARWTNVWEQDSSDCCTFLQNLHTP